MQQDLHFFLSQLFSEDPPRPLLPFSRSAASAPRAGARALTVQVAAHDYDYDLVIIGAGVGGRGVVTATLASVTRLVFLRGTTPTPACHRLVCFGCHSRASLDSSHGPHRLPSIAPCFGCHSRGVSDWWPWATPAAVKPYRLSSVVD